MGVSVSAKLFTEHASEYLLPTLLKAELKVLDFVKCLEYYYFVMLDSFPLFLPFLTSVIKFIL